MVGKQFANLFIHRLDRLALLLIALQNIEKAIVDLVSEQRVRSTGSSG
jgi:hypothetical protein